MYHGGGEFPIKIERFNTLRARGLHQSFLSVVPVILGLIGCLPVAKCLEAAPEIISWALKRELPHDPTAFTQGLEVLDGRYFLESTGQYGQSEIRKVDRTSGQVVSRKPLDGKYFGEGLTRVGDKILQLTWREGVILRWKMGKKADGFVADGSLPWKGEGWGVTQGAGMIWVSNGSNELMALDPKSLAVRKTLKVTLSGEPMDRLNELEFINGKIFANVWMTSTIVRIDRTSGVIDGLLDLGPLIPKGVSIEAVPNGIAWDPEKKLLYVTGKLWPKVFELKLKSY